MNLRLRTFQFVGALALGGLVAACGAGQPNDALVDARRTYAQAAQGKAAQYVPDHVLAARQALDQAEKANEQEGDTFTTRSLAYVAQRRAQLAMTYADMAEAARARQTAQNNYRQLQSQFAAQAQSEAARLRLELEQVRQQMGQGEAGAEALRQREQYLMQQLQQARQDRRQAEDQARAALASLEQIANVREDARGMVISLSGAVLFTTGSSELLPVAKQNLERVAVALRNQPDNQRIIVEGHTDSRGSDQLNQKLSQERAESVRDYLIQEGVNANQIEAVGRGENQPIATNDTAEGRANNRRVEIVIPKQQTGQQHQGTQGSRQQQQQQPGTTSPSTEPGQQRGTQQTPYGSQPGPQQTPYGSQPGPQQTPYGSQPGTQPGTPTERPGSDNPYGGQRTNPNPTD